MARKIEKFNFLKNKNSERFVNSELTNQLNSFATAQNDRGRHSELDSESINVGYNNIPDKYFSLFTKPSRGISEAKVEPQSTETLSFRCWSERCRLMRGAVNNQKSKVAFTLAEVLITLGIIGVVAALTMPALIENHRKQVTISKLKKVYSTISQAYMLAKNDNGDIENWKLRNYEDSQNDDEDVLYYLLPYLKVQKFCGKNEQGCFPDVVYKSLGSFGLNINFDRNRWYSNAILEDGTSIASITFSGNNAVIRVDINGSNPPNVLGIDLFGFNVLPEKVVPMGILGVSANASNSDQINRGDYCAAWVIYGNTMDYIKDKKCEPYK